MAARKNYTAAQIINGLRRAEVGLANGKSMKEVIRDLGVSEQTYYRWRREYGGMKVKSRFVCKSGGSSSPSARLLGRPPVSGGVRGRGNAGRPRRVWS